MIHLSGPQSGTAFLGVGGKQACTGILQSVAGEMAWQAKCFLQVRRPEFRSSAPKNSSVGLYPSAGVETGSSEGLMASQSKQKH